MIEPVIVPDELTDAELEWVNDQLELVGAHAVRQRDLYAELERARATGRRPAYLDRMSSRNESREIAGLPPWFTTEDVYS